MQQPREQDDIPCNEELNGELSKTLDESIGESSVSCEDPVSCVGPCVQFTIGKPDNIPSGMELSSELPQHPDGSIVESSVLPQDPVISAGPPGELTVVQPRLKFSDEYQIGEGLFVIIKNTEHSFTYLGTNFSQTRLNYDEDVKKLLKTFKINENSPNLVLGEEITPDFQSHLATDEEKAKMFTNFMNEKVLAYQRNPSFVFFVFLSHGFSDGSVLLSAKNSCKCKGNQHSFTGQCVARRGYDDIIKPIQEYQKFHGIPKIIIMQTCRGSAVGVVKTGTKADPPSGKLAPHMAPDFFIPELSDTIVLYAATKEHSAYVGKGSLLIKAFCEAAKELEDCLSNCEQKKIDFAKETGIRIENLINGWIYDILLKVSAKVSQMLVTDKNKINDKQQPVFVSSLRYKLSFLEMLQSVK